MCFIAQVYSPAYSKGWHCVLVFNYIIQSTNPPELHDAFEGGIVVMAVCIKIKLDNVTSIKINEYNSECALLHKYLFKTFAVSINNSISGLFIDRQSYIPA